VIADTSREEHKRVIELERCILELGYERQAREKKMLELRNLLTQKTTQLEQAEARAEKATKRAELGEDMHRRAMGSAVTEHVQERLKEGQS